MNKNLIKKIDVTTNFVYFPLHFEPERVLLIGAPYYTNQIEFAKNVAKSLPVGYKLYVKEHPAMNISSWRPISFYKQIMDLPNVYLIHPSVSTEEIIKKCSTVVTIGGTTGLEATMLKPVIVFSDVIYSELPSVYRLEKIEELPNAIRSSLTTKVNLFDLIKYYYIWFDT